METLFFHFIISFCIEKTPFLINLEQAEKVELSKRLEIYNF